MTMYYLNGNLRNFFQKLSANKQIRHEKIGLDVIGGLSYLEKQTVCKTLLYNKVFVSIYFTMHPSCCILS